MAKFEPYPYALLEGNIVKIEDAKISIMTNALQYGCGIFGGIKVYSLDGNMSIFRLDDHITRLSDSAKTLRFPYVINSESIKRQIIELAKKNNLSGTTYIRPIIYRSDLNLAPEILGDYDLAIYMLKMDENYLHNKGVSVQVSSWVRNSDNSLPPRTKATGGYLNSALAIYDAHQAGYDSAIMLNNRGEVCEGAVMNIFIVKNGKLVTPGIDSDALEGITRRTVIEIAKKLDVKVIEGPVKRSQLYTADEVFFTGTAVEVTWCHKIDNITISNKPGKLTKRIQSEFDNLPNTRPELFTSL